MPLAKRSTTEVFGSVELMLAHDYSAASGHSDVTRGLRQFRDNFVIGHSIGGKRDPRARTEISAR